MPPRVERSPAGASVLADWYEGRGDSLWAGWFRGPAVGTARRQLLHDQLGLLFPGARLERVAPGFGLLLDEAPYAVSLPDALIWSVEDPSALDAMLSWPPHQAVTAVHVLDPWEAGGVGLISRLTTTRPDLEVLDVVGPCEAASFLRLPRLRALGARLAPTVGVGGTTGVRRLRIGFDSADELAAWASIATPALERLELAPSSPDAIEQLVLAPWGLESALGRLLAGRPSTLLEAPAALHGAARRALDALDRPDVAIRERPADPPAWALAR